MLLGGTGARCPTIFYPPSNILFDTTRFFHFIFPSNNSPTKMRLFSLATFAILCAAIPLRAQMDEGMAKSLRLIKENITHDYPGMLHPPGGSFKYPYVTPGSVYSHDLWDWDSWLSDVALCQILTEHGTPPAQAVTYGQGCVLNFLTFATADGTIPIVVQDERDAASQMPTGPSDTNMHKPVLAQHAAFLTRLNGGNAAWLREKFPLLQAFIKNYHDHSRHTATGLYYWKDDFAIGVDNDPSSFFRPPGSSGSIFLNCLMYKELLSMAYLTERLGLPKATADGYRHEAADLRAAIQKNCWDERDGFFYSVDLNLLPITNRPRPFAGGEIVLHSGHPRDYDCLIQRLGVWSGFMAMWAGIATPEQAGRMVAEHLENPKTFGAAYGVRSLSKMEKMYGLYASGNPSNWDGPVWGISNYKVFQGLRKYGFNAQAKEMLTKTIKLFGQDYERTGTLHEYYDPDTGAPIINPGFQNWNYLVMNMAAWLEGLTMVEEF